MGTDKNKQLTIVKPTQNGINRNKYTFCILKSLEPLKKFKNQLRPLVRPSQPTISTSVNTTWRTACILWSAQEIALAYRLVQFHRGPQNSRFPAPASAPPPPPHIMCLPKSKTLRTGPYKSLVHKWFYEHENALMVMRGPLYLKGSVRHVTGNDKDYLRKSPEWFGRNPRLTKGHYRVYCQPMLPGETRGMKRVRVWLNATF